MSVYDVKLVEPRRDWSEPLLSMGREFAVEQDPRYPSSPEQLDPYFESVARLFALSFIISS